MNSQAAPAGYDVVTVGQATHDIVFTVDHHPGPDEKTTASGLVRSGGGPAANAAVTAARMGVRTAFIGYLGRDDLGEMHVEELNEVGVDTRHIQRGRAPTPLSTILVHQDASRTVVNFRDKRATVDIDRLALDTGSMAVLLFDGHEPETSIELASTANSRGTQTILDAGSLHAGTRRLAGLVDTVICSEKFAREWSGSSKVEEMLGSLAATAGEIVITLGERGLVWTRKGETGKLPAYPIEAVDTTGAGDVFHGAFAVGAALNWGWRDNLRFASAAAAIACTRPGGRPGIPSRGQVEEFLAAQKANSC